MNSLIDPQQHLHFIGVGGIGMSALALILAKQGLSVSGSDQSTKINYQDLSNQGILIFKQQIAENINTICQGKNIKPIIIRSTAIPNNNPELKAAKKANLRILHRSDILADLIKQHKSIVVAGSHGKTTTSTIISTLLALTNNDPTIVIGGIVPHYGCNGHKGKSDLLVAEADESDGTLIKFKSDLGVITNLELDHTDHYKDLNDLIKTMQAFQTGCKRVLANYDCKNLREHIEATAWWSVKTSKGVDFAALPIELNGHHSIANIYENEKIIGQINLPITGLHNLSNTVAAIGACRMQGIVFEELQSYIPSLKAPKRRFDFRGIWQGRQIVDDYAHHPSEVLATISMAKNIIKTGISPFPKEPKRLFVVFQPHRYSRTKTFLQDFALSLGEADLILLAPIYSAGEKMIPQINNHALANEIKRLFPKMKIIIAKERKELTYLVKKHSLENDLILTMGAGDINNLWEQLITQRKHKQWTTYLAA